MDLYRWSDNQLIKLMNYSISVSTPTENLKVTVPFTQWMEAHANLRDICNEGKGKCRPEKSAIAGYVGIDNFFWIDEKS